MIADMGNELIDGVQIVRVIMTGAQPGELAASQLWYAVLPRDQALEAVKKEIPPGWGAELTTQQLTPQQALTLKLRYGDVGELS